MADPVDVVRVSCVGASVVQGTGSTDGKNGWPEQLGRLLGGRATVTNFGHGGRTVFGPHLGNGKAYLCSERFYASLTCPADVVLVMAPSNDGNPKNAIPASLGGRLDAHWLGVYACELRDLLTIYQHLSTHPTVLLCPTPAMCKTADMYPLGAEMLNAFYENLADMRAIQRQVACEMGIGIIDKTETALDPADCYAPDALHPNDHGYGVLAQTIYDDLTGAYHIFEKKTGKDDMSI